MNMVTSDDFPTMHSFGSPGMVERIGKVMGDFDMELSPIAPSRDSYNNNNSPPLQSAQSRPREIISNGATSSPSAEIRETIEHATRPSLKTTANDFSSTGAEYRSGQQPTDGHTSEPIHKMDSKPWFLASESSPPMSTSIEFSLDSLTVKEINSDDSGGLEEVEQEKETTPKSEGPNEGKEPISPFTIANHHTSSSTEQQTISGPGEYDQSHGATQQSDSSAHVAGNSVSGVEGGKLSAENLRANELASELVADTKMESLLQESDNVIQRAELSSEKVMASETTLELTADTDTDALIQDATEKVKKFIHELSVLEVSRQSSSRNSASSSNGSPQKEFSPHPISEDHEKNVTRSESRPIDSSSSMVPEEGEGQLGHYETTNNNQTGLEANNIRFDHEFEDSSNVFSDSHSCHLDSKYENMSQTYPGIPTMLSPSNTRNNDSKAPIGSGEVGTPSTPGKYDFSDAKKEVGMASSGFIQTLRGAAQRRKQNLARSRDSLVAKEKEQREAIAASTKAPKQKSPTTLARLKKDVEDEPLIDKVALANTSFKAKPLPPTNGESGIGGMRGVPKVVKKPTTVPSSPLLGSRRPNPPKVKALAEPPTKPRSSNKHDSMVQKKKAFASSHRRSSTFKARPLPSTTGDLGRSGQVGVPKVAKRPVTIPNSPCLGPRRRQSSAITVPGKENQTQTKSSSTGMVKIIQGSASGQSSKVAKASPMSISSLSQRSPALLGLDLLSTASACDDDSVRVQTPTNARTSSGFEPRSTQRAEKRAEFEARRAANEQRRMEEEMRNRGKKVREIHKELDSLRESL